MRTLLLLLSVFCVLSVTSCSTRVVARPNSVTIIKTPPKHYSIVKVRGNKYYFWNGKHFKKTQRGYVFVKI